MGACVATRDIAPSVRLALRPTWVPLIAIILLFIVHGGWGRLPAPAGPRRPFRHRPVLRETARGARPRVTSGC